MPTLPRANRNLIRSINRSIILNAIKTQAVVSRAAIAHLTGLSPATVTAITGQLIKEGLIFEKTTGDSTGGRPPIMLALNPRGGFVIGIKLMEDQVVGALTDLNATILAKDSTSLSSVDVETVVETVAALVTRLIHTSDIRKKQLMGVGVGLAGVVDYADGIVRQNPFFGWQNIPLRDLLQTRLKVPIFIDNDVNTLTLSEKWLGVGKPVENFVVITIGRGVGMGIVLDGRIYRGRAGGAGEFGHVVVDPSGPLCDCGKHGCLESLVSDRALVQTARREVDSNIENLDGLLKLAQAGRPEALAVLKQAGGLLGREIANLVNVLDPNLIVISGEGIRMGETFFSAVRTTFHENVMPGLAEDTEIRVDSWGDDIWALGAASLVIAGIFNSPI